jgi:hypothetical protein
MFSSTTSWRRIACVLVAALALGRFTFAQSPPVATQIITLDPGWNLISIQVGGATTPAAFSAALSHPERLIEILGL